MPYFKRDGDCSSQISNLGMEVGRTREVRKGRFEFSKTGKGNREKLKGIFSFLHTNDDKLSHLHIFLSRNLQFQQGYTYPLAA